MSVDVNHQLAEALPADSLNPQTNISNRFEGTTMQSVNIRNLRPTQLGPLTWRLLAADRRLSGQHRS
jgi:hypothetical protein